MKMFLTCAVVLALSIPAWAVDGIDAGAKTKVAKPDQATAKAEKQAAAQLQKQATKTLSQPLSAEILKIDGTTITVRTQPMMGPDGLIPAREKTYDTTNATVVVINGETKTLAALTVGAPARIQITNDGKTLEHIESKAKTPAAKKAATKKDPAEKPGVGTP